MVAHRRLADIHALGDLPVLDSFADQLDDLALAFSQLGDPQRLDILIGNAGIAGSSALTIAACGALAHWTHRSSAADDLLNVAMNVECQTIRVPTGVQDYRPALYGGIAAIELGVSGIQRVGLDVDPRGLEDRIVLAYTGLPRHSGTKTRIRAGARLHSGTRRRPHGAGREPAASVLVVA